MAEMVDCCGCCLLCCACVCELYRNPSPNCHQTHLRPRRTFQLYAGDCVSGVCLPFSIFIRTYLVSYRQLVPWPGDRRKAKAIEEDEEFARQVELDTYGMSPPEPNGANYTQPTPRDAPVVNPTRQSRSAGPPKGTPSFGSLVCFAEDFDGRLIIC